MNTYTLHKLPEGFIITSDEHFNTGNIVVSKDYSAIAKVIEFKKGHLLLRDVISRKEYAAMYHEQSDWLKVIAQQNQIDFSALSEDNCKKIGWFDDIQFIKNEFGFIEELFNEWENELSKSKFADLGNFLNLLKKQRELLSDRMFSLEDMEAAACFGMALEKFKDDKHKLSDNEEWEGFIKSLSQKSWKVECVEEDNKIKILKLSY